MSRSFGVILDVRDIEPALTDYAFWLREKVNR